MMHGSTSSYVQGCRCSECKRAMSEYQRAYRSMKKATPVAEPQGLEKPPADVSHGTWSAYVGGCRCEWCSEAARDYQRGYQARVREEGRFDHGTLARYTAGGCRCEACRTASRDYRRAKKYGLTPADYDDLLTAQGGLCASCREEPSNKNGFHVDHDHETGAVRGLLCHGCNVALGQLHDDPGRIRSLARYVERTRSAADPEVEGSR